MILYKTQAGRFLNMAFLVDTEEGRAKDGRAFVDLVFASPQPAGVGAASWSVQSRSVRLVGPEVEEVLSWLQSRLEAAERAEGGDS